SAGVRTRTSVARTVTSVGARRDRSFGHLARAAFGHDCGIRQAGACYVAARSTSARDEDQRGQEARHFRACREPGAIEFGHELLAIASTAERRLAMQFVKTP